MVVLIGCSYIARTTVANYIQCENINTNFSRSWLYYRHYLNNIFTSVVSHTDWLYWSPFPDRS